MMCSGLKHYRICHDILHYIYFLNQILHTPLQYVRGFLFCFCKVLPAVYSMLKYLGELAAGLWSANAKLQGLICLSESMGRGCVWEGFLETAGFARSSSFPVLFWLIVHRDAQFSSLMECAWIILNCRTLLLNIYIYILWLTQSWEENPVSLAHV